MSIRSMLLVCACLFSTLGGAQINQVLNPSFEDNSQCPDNWDGVTYANHWNTLDSSWRAPDWVHDKAGAPDYCHVCALGINSLVSVPRNVSFYHYPRSGDGLMQVQMYYNISDIDMVSRDYLQGHLRNTLVSGHAYQVAFYTCAEEASFCNTNNIGAYLDDGSIDSTVNPGWTQSLYTPQVLDTNVITDTVNWTKIEGTFTAIGNEKFITIGNFKDRFNTRAVPFISSAYEAWSWYLIEDVSVIDCSNVPFAGRDTLIRPGDSVYLGVHEELIPYTWYKLGDTTAIDSGGGTMVHPTITTTYLVKQDLCKAVKWDTVKVRVWPDTVTEVNSAIWQLDNLAMWPNPASQSLTVSGAKGLSFGVYDLVGRCVAAPVIATEKEVLLIGQLAKGVYFIRIMDVGTGEVVTRRFVKE